MRFQVSSTEINHGMSQVSRALLPRATKPAYDGVFIETMEEGVQLTCTNGEMTIRCVVPAIVHEDGCALLPAKLLFELLRKLEGDINFSFEGTQRAMIQSDGSRTNMLCMEAGDFPEISEVVGEYTVKMPQNKLRDAILRVVFAISTDETRRILTGCLMETAAEEIRFVCLDGFRLAMQRVYVSHELPKGKELLSAILPGAIIGEIARMVADSEEEMELRCSATHMMASFGKTKVYCPLIPGEYINYRQILPNTWTTSMRVNRQMIMNAIERAALIAREGNNNLLKLQMDEEGLTILANADRGAAEEKLDIDFEGSPLNIAFNARYLTDVMKNIDTPDMSLRFNTNVSPCVICPVTGNQYTYLVLPVRLAE